MLKWLVARMSEGSSWRGLVWLLTALGVSLSPEVWAHITTIGMAAAGLIGVLTSEKAAVVDIQLPAIELVGVAGGADPVADRSAVDRRVQQPVQPVRSSVAATNHDGADFPGWGS